MGSLNQSVGSVSASFPSSSSSEDQSLKKIIKEQSLVIQSQGNEIGRLSAAVRYLATKDSTLANILQSEDVPSSHNSEGMSHDSRDDESDAI